MHNYNIVYIMMFFLASVAGTSTYFGMRNLYPMTVSFVSQERFFAHQSASFTLQVSNSAEYSVYDIDFSYKNIHNYVSTLASKEQKLLHFKVSVAQRGVMQLEELHLESFFPLIHERKLREISIDKKLLIYPMPQGESLFERKGVQEKESGEVKEFDTLEEFTQGESLSSLHWPSLAKSETLLKKVFLYEDEEKKFHFDFDALSGDTQSRLSQLTLWILECEEHGYIFTLRLHQRSYNSQKESIDAILKALALF